MLPTTFRQQFTDIRDACALAQGIVDTVHEPVLVLDKALGVIAASRSFYSAFKVRPEETQGQHLYEVAGTNWKLSVADNGVGKPEGVFAQAKPGLGTGIVKAIAQQLGADVETLAGPDGTTVAITHATFETKAIRAA